MRSLETISPSVGIRCLHNGSGGQDTGNLPRYGRLTLANLRQSKMTGLQRLIAVLARHRRIWLPPLVTIAVVFGTLALLQGHKLSQFVYRVF